MFNTTCDHFFGLVKPVVAIMGLVQPVVARLGLVQPDIAGMGYKVGIVGQAVGGGVHPCTGVLAMTLENVSGRNLSEGASDDGVPGLSSNLTSETELNTRKFLQQAGINQNCSSTIQAGGQRLPRFQRCLGRLVFALKQQLS